MSVTRPTLIGFFCELLDDEPDEPEPPLDELLESGHVLSLNFPVAMNPGLARALGVLLKLDFQRAVDKLFSFGGFRGEEEENPVHLARTFRGLAGFSDDEISELVDTAAEAYAEAQAMQATAAAGA